MTGSTYDAFQPTIAAVVVRHPWGVVAVVAVLTLAFLTILVAPEAFLAGVPEVMRTPGHHHGFYGWDSAVTPCLLVVLFLALQAPFVIAAVDRAPERIRLWCAATRAISVTFIALTAILVVQVFLEGTDRLGGTGSVRLPEDSLPVSGTIAYANMGRWAPWTPACAAAAVLLGLALGRARRTGSDNVTSVWSDAVSVMAAAWMLTWIALPVHLVIRGSRAALGPYDTGTWLPVAIGTSMLAWALGPVALSSVMLASERVTRLAPASDTFRIPAKDYLASARGLMIAMFALALFGTDVARREYQRLAVLADARAAVARWYLGHALEGSPSLLPAVAWGVAMPVDDLPGAARVTKLFDGPDMRSPPSARFASLSPWTFTIRVAETLGARWAVKLDLCHPLPYALEKDLALTDARAVPPCSLLEPSAPGSFRVTSSMARVMLATYSKAQRDWADGAMARVSREVHTRLQRDLPSVSPPVPERFSDVEQAIQSQEIKIPFLDPEFPAHAVPWIVAVVVLGLLVTARNKLAAVLRDPTLAIEEPWFLVDASTPWERAASAAALVALGLIPWVLGASLFALTAASVYAEGATSSLSWDLLRFAGAGALMIPAALAAAGCALTITKIWIHRRELRLGAGGEAASLERGSPVGSGEGSYRA